MMMTAIKKSQIVAATVAVIAMSAMATPSHAHTVKAAAKKTTTVTTTRVAPKTTTIVNQHSDGTSDTVMVRPRWVRHIAFGLWKPSMNKISPDFERA